MSLGQLLVCLYYLLGLQLKQGLLLYQYNFVNVLHLFYFFCIVFLQLCCNAVFLTTRDSYFTLKARPAVELPFIKYCAIQISNVIAVALVVIPILKFNQ